MLLLNKDISVKITERSCTGHPFVCRLSSTGRASLRYAVALVSHQSCRTSAVRRANPERVSAWNIAIGTNSE